MILLDVCRINLLVIVLLCSVKSWGDKNDGLKCFYLLALDIFYQQYFPVECDLLLVIFIIVCFHFIGCVLNIQSKECSETNKRDV